MNIDLKPEYLIILKEILSKFQYKFYIYGSRVRGDTWKFSDIDICYKEEIPAKVVGDIREALEESNLPYHVDLVNLNQVSDEFAKIVEAHMQLIS